MPGTTPGLPAYGPALIPLPAPRTSDPCGLSLLPPSYLIAEGGSSLLRWPSPPAPGTCLTVQDPRFLISGTFWSWETTAGAQGTSQHCPSCPPGALRGGGPPGSGAPGVETPFPLPACTWLPAPPSHLCSGPPEASVLNPHGTNCLARGSTS